MNATHRLLLPCLAFISMMLVLDACKKTEPVVPPCTDAPTLSLNFHGMVGTDTFLLAKDYNYFHGLHFNINLLRFFVSDVTLLTDTGEVKLTDLAVIDFHGHHGSIATVKQGEILQLSTPPVGQYRGIRFGIGVPADLNSLQPTNFPSSSPLSEFQNYWDAWHSYIFGKSEGQCDTIGSTLSPNSFLYHTGSDRQYTVKTILKPFEIKTCTATHLQMTFDVKRLFYSDIDTINLRTNNFVHASDPSQPNYDINKFIAGQYGEAITIQ